MNIIPLTSASKDALVIDDTMMSVIYDIICSSERKMWGRS